jgi:dienelactone hydrolase
LIEVSKNNLIKGAAGRLTLFDMHFRPNGVQKPIILYVHGFNGFKDWGNFDLIANYFSEQGFFFIKMNLSHNGTTVDQPDVFADLDAYSQNNYSKELEDIEKMLDWVFDEVNPYSIQFNRQKIVLLGHSRGGGISLIKASEDTRIKALITWAAINECKTPWGNWSPEKMKDWKDNDIVYIKNQRTQQLMPIRYQLYQDYERHSSRFNIEYATRSLQIPFQACHGSLDEAVPYENLSIFKTWNRNCHTVTIESNHVFDRYHPYEEDFIPPHCQKVLDANILFLQNQGF